MPGYPFTQPHLTAEIEAIRDYTARHRELAACHHFCFDFRLGNFERADWLVMGMNPGETKDDRDTAPGPAEESSLVDYRDGEDSRSRARWFGTCRKVLASDRVTLSELCFWSSPNITALIARIGRLKRSPHLVFCRDLNQRLISFHQPKAVVLPGLGLMRLTADLYGLTHRNSKPDSRGRRLIEHYERDGVPWVFTKHWSGSFGFSDADREEIRTYLAQLGA